MPAQLYIPPYNAANVLVGPAAVYLAPGSYVALPPQTNVLGGDWTAGGTLPWTPVGASEKGATFSFDETTNDIMIDEQVNPAMITVTKADIQVTVTMAEDTLQSMYHAYGGGVITTQVATTGAPSASVLTLSSQLQTFSLALEGANPQGYHRRVYIPAINSAGKVDTAYNRASNAREYAATFRAICPPTAIQIFEFTGPYTGAPAGWA